MIPLPTTTILVKRPSVEDDPTDESTFTTVVSGVRAHISTSRGRENMSGGGTQELVYWRLSCDPCDLTRFDMVVDEKTGEEYNVEWARLRQGIGGLDHIEAGLNQITGVVSQPSRSDF